MSPIQFHPLAEHCGVEARGVDLRTLDDAGMAALRAAVADRGVLMIHGQDLTPDDQIAFARRWGDIVINRFFQPTQTHPEIAEVRKSETQTVNIGGGWHTDHSYEAAPAMGSILLARQTPPEGGDTVFSNLSAVYDSLSPGLKATLEGLRAEHSTEKFFGAEGVFAKSDRAADMTGLGAEARTVHPVVIRHPTTGRRILYVNPAFTTRFEGWTPEESKSLLMYLYSVAMKPAWQCRLQWAPGSIAVWDNRSTWHRAVNDYQGHARLMHRITIAGEPLN